MALMVETGAGRAVLFSSAYAVRPDSKFQVFDAVVRPIPVLVVNRFPTRERSTEMLFHHQTMFQHVLPAASLRNGVVIRTINEHVATSKDPAAFPAGTSNSTLGSSGASRGTSPRAIFTPRCVERFRDITRAAFLTRLGNTPYARPVARWVVPPDAIPIASVVRSLPLHNRGFLGHLPGRSRLVETASRAVDRPRRCRHELFLAVRAPLYPAPLTTARKLIPPLAVAVLTESISGRYHPPIVAYRTVTRL